MKLTPICAGLALLALASAGVADRAVAKDDDRAEAEKLLQQVRDRTDIRSPGSPPFRLVATIQILGDKEKIIEGTYNLLWQGPTV